MPADLGQRTRSRQSSWKSSSLGPSSTSSSLPPEWISSTGHPSFSFYFATSLFLFDLFAHLEPFLVQQHPLLDLSLSIPYSTLYSPILPGGSVFLEATMPSLFPWQERTRCGSNHCQSICWKPAMHVGGPVEHWIFWTCVCASCACGPGEFARKCSLLFCRFVFLTCTRFWAVISAVPAV